MEAVGRLAGGIAHDFTNLVTAILGYSNLALEKMSLDDALRHDVEEIRAAGDRAASLTRQLLAFSRREMLLPQVVDLNVLVAQMEKVLRRLAGSDIEMVTRLTPELTTVRVDPSSIEQVLLNLAVNARDAMPDGGRLTIETANVEHHADGFGRIGPMPTGRYVTLAVADTGVGMDDATRARLFEPFFTTKEQGVGLGLATVYGIVRQSGGYIFVASQPSRGTTLRVFFPPVNAVELSIDDDAEVDKKRGWETVLLVEDEDAVRALAREVLRRHGYVVIEARHGLDALRLAERHPDNIHLLVTDIVMPHMNGRDLADRLRSGRPDLKVLFVSGAMDRDVVHADTTAGTSFLLKPFRPDTLARKVRRALDAADPARAMS
jgi:CheY-like chemotaxis protein